MKRRTAIAAALTGSAAITAAGVAFAGSSAFAAGLAADKKPVPPPGIEAHSATDKPGSATAYWTPERMAKAKPLDPRKGPHSLSGLSLDKGAPHTVDPVPPKAPAVSKAIGKEFFEELDATTGTWQGFECSGAVVSSPHGNVVATAGHCVVSSDTHVRHRHWIFVPDYLNGGGTPIGPYGVYEAKKFHYLTAWAQHGDFGSDVAFVEVRRNAAGHQVQTIVGGMGLKVSQPFKEAITAIGYPGKLPFDGETQQYCRGTSHRNNRVGQSHHQIEIKCNLSAGASGGPWLLKYNRHGYGFINGVNSNNNDTNWSGPNPVSNATVMDSPYFGNMAWALYEDAAHI